MHRQHANKGGVSQFPPGSERAQRVGAYCQCAALERSFSGESQKMCVDSPHCHVRTNTPRARTQQNAHFCGLLTVRVFACAHTMSRSFSMCTHNVPNTQKSHSPLMPTAGFIHNLITSWLCLLQLTVIAFLLLLLAVSHIYLSLLFSSFS